MILWSFSLQTSHVSFGVSSTPSILGLFRRDQTSNSISFLLTKSVSRRFSSKSFILAWSFPVSFFIFVSSSSSWPCVNSELFAISITSWDILSSGLFVFSKCVLIISPTFSSCSSVSSFTIFLIVSKNPSSLSFVD